MSAIATLNDSLRKTFTGGKIVMTRGVAAMVADVREQNNILRAVREFDAFTNDNDPHGEHDFGAVEVDGDRYFWKIDYYDRAMEYGSENPADPSQTTRVLTIMRADEY